MISEVSSILGVPVVATTAEEKVAQQLGDFDCMGNPVRPLKRYMPATFW
ncbi:hypothetical protein N752_15605 [Desulforamulus aquiferis]|nr:hypothetical protein [Desulforamulus aquiferis]RYD04268.1 hypothetical protein N752_15605 [Desulforamulus aquiferis]